MKLYGQEINLITSAIARMNMFMHGIEEFSIVRGDTLANPSFLYNDNEEIQCDFGESSLPIKAWDQKHLPMIHMDEIYGEYSQGCADYAFQHIQKSLNADNGRSISFHHMVYFLEILK